MEALVVNFTTLGIVLILAAGNALFSEVFLPWGIVFLIVGVVLLATARVIAKRK